jgi:hypothetical protein
LTSNQIDSGKKSFIKMLDIKSKKQLSLTATIKETDNESCIANNSIEHFGDIIDRKTMLWAIENKIICDYSLQTIITSEDNLAELSSYNVKVNGAICNIDKNLIFAAYAALKSISCGDTHHILIYSNSIASSQLILIAIKMLLSFEYFTIDIFRSCYHGDMDASLQKDILTKFDNATCGIISCVYCLGEGWDFPKLNGVVFGEDMSSNIRIVQSASRACRKNINDPTKIFKIIIPYIECITSDYKKIREVVYQIGLEDETVCQKMVVYNIGIEKGNRTGKYSIGECDIIVTKELLLKTTARKDLTLTYDKAVALLKNKNINSKEKYYELCEKNIRIPYEPDIEYRGKFIDWIVYLGIQGDFYDFEECKRKAKEYIKQDESFRDYIMDYDGACRKLCLLDDKFPPVGLWCSKYRVGTMSDIIKINNSKRCNNVPEFL